MDINLYSKVVKNKMKRGDVIELKRIKITEFVKEGQIVKRLVTTARSTAEAGTSDTNSIFKNIPLGDHQAVGKVIAIHDIVPYLSCSSCWKKTSEDDLICQCQNQENIHVNDFHCKFYLEIMNSDDINVIHTFRRQTSFSPETQDTDCIQKALDNIYLNKKITFEWNVISSEEEDDDDLKMVKITEAEVTI